MLCSDKGELSIDKSVTLYHAAAILRSYINDVVGIPYQPLDPRNISVESSENIVSDEIYNFFIGPSVRNFQKTQAP